MYPPFNDRHESAFLVRASSAAVFGLALTCSTFAGEDPAASQAGEAKAVIEFTRNRVEVLRAGATAWDAASTNANYNQLRPGDQLRTGEASRAGLRLPGHRSTLILDSNSRLLIPADASKKEAFNLLRGRLFNFHRGSQDEQRFLTPTVSAIVRGTDFTVEVDAAGTTTISMLNGEVTLETEYGDLAVRSGEQAVASPGRAPYRTSLITAMEVIQWCLHYPAVLDPADVPFSPADHVRLKSSLTAYAAGNLSGAFAALPADWDAGSSSERLYGSAVLLSVGLVSSAERTLEAIGAASEDDPGSKRILQLAKALRSMAATVKLQRPPPADSRRAEPSLSTECLVESYRRQAAGKLEEALVLARQAVQTNPAFGFGWARVAELEFGFGNAIRTKGALTTALELGPENAQAVALQGFVLAAKNQIAAALREFDRAIALDPTLANGWLGRGLCELHRHQKDRGLDDLQMAATVEPQRSLLRSYLGKAFGEAGHDERAMQELGLAEQLDPADPTPWLYSALILHNENRTADAIEYLEKSKRLNDNRAVYRSRLLLDQDEAVRSANLANIFADAGMSDVSVRESARAVSFDYANFSAHLNLASSFDQLRDPTRFNLRYESQWFNEHLLASLLAPVGAGSLSQNLSQHEYSSLFERNNVGLASSTIYRSDGQLRQLASQFGTIGNTSWALDLDYQHNDGVRPNNDLDRLEWYSRIKQQLGPQDSLLVLLKYQDYDAGDNFQYYDPDAARPDFRFSETQTPLALAGWHHEWSPGVHTLFLGGRLVNDQDASDQGANQLVAIVNPPNFFDPTNTIPFDVDYHSEFETYTAELNQIFQRSKHTDILGLRFQSGNFQANASLDNPQAGTNLFTLPEISATDADFQRLSLYAYHHWEIVDNLLLIGGVAYDRLDYPANYRRPPLESSESSQQHWSPKAAFIWDVTPHACVRGIFSQSVGGVSYDESVRLEPVQLAGFAQSFRSLISESLVGSVEAPVYQVAGGAVDLRPGPNTWLTLQGGQRQEDVTRDFGLFYLDFAPPGSATAANTVEELDYQEWHARAVFNQILGREWFLEALYQFTHSELERQLPAIPATPGFARTTTLSANLHQGGLAAMWRSPTGFFARGEFMWYTQELGGDSPQPPGDSFPQVNLFAGYRFPKRRGELTVGVLNLTDQDYHLSPLNYYLEMPRERAFYLRLQFNF